ncbi:hypothetical protein ACJJIF_17555 [Microbulbifer sp. SSSA002]|uniref:hypothetical protein n=1 Tax=unclassified Microbulbifer TaxID=2619833 RepID=UPI004039E3FD
MKSSTALYQLKNYPEIFLGSNLIKITGSKKTEVMDYQFGTYTMNMGASGDDKPNELFAFDPNGTFIEDPQTVKVHHIRMIDWSEKLSLDRIEPYQMRNGADIMVTGQLSDCCFCIGGHNANMPVVAHIRPRKNQGLNGKATHNAVINQGKFWVFGGVQKSLGRSALKPHHHNYTDYASVVGVRIDNQWQIYAQHLKTPKGPIQAVTRLL